MKKLIVMIALLPVMYSCNNQSNDKATMAIAKQQVLDSLNQVSKIKQQVLDSIEIASLRAEKEQANTVVVNRTNRVVVPADNYVRSSNPSTDVTPVAYSTKKKKKMSNAAKGAIIGAGVGALAGAAVSKKRGKGAIIGGIIGAGTGAVTGVVIDKRKKQKTAQQSTPTIYVNN